MAFLLALVGEPNWAGLAEAVLDVRGSGSRQGGRGSRDKPRRHWQRQLLPPHCWGLFPYGFAVCRGAGEFSLTLGRARTWESPSPVSQHTSDLSRLCCSLGKFPKALENPKAQAGLRVVSF